eukprot:scaffold987_cov183-Amphora_coffeaeformis.AAC.10
MPEALAWLFGKLERGLAVSGDVLGIRDVKGKLLTPVKTNRLLANGKSDGCIAKESLLAPCDRTKESYYSYGMALVEMKTNMSYLILSLGYAVMTLVGYSSIGTEGCQPSL